MDQKKAGVLLSYGQTILSTLISLVYTPVMLRLLGQSEYGLYTLVNGFISNLSLMSFGLGSAYMRYYARAEAENGDDGVANRRIRRRAFGRYLRGGERRRAGHREMRRRGDGLVIFRRLGDGRHELRAGLERDGSDRMVFRHLERRAVADCNGDCRAVVRERRRAANAVKVVGVVCVVRERSRPDLAQRRRRASGGLGGPVAAVLRIEAVAVAGLRERHISAADTDFEDDIARLGGKMNAVVALRIERRVAGELDRPVAEHEPERPVDVGLPGVRQPGLRRHETHVRVVLAELALEATVVAVEAHVVADDHIAGSDHRRTNDEELAPPLQPAVCSGDNRFKRESGRDFRLGGIRYETDVRKPDASGAGHSVEKDAGISCGVLEVHRSVHDDDTCRLVSIERNCRVSVDLGRICSRGNTTRPVGGILPLA